MKVNTIIEMPRGTSVKYEIQNGRLVVDRILKQCIPFNYGFILDTKAEDGDPLDIFILDSPAIYPRSMYSVKIIGAFKCIDNGVEDHKLIGHITKREFLEQDLKVIKKYLTTYKKGFKVLKYVGRTEAERIYRACKNT